MARLPISTVYNNLFIDGPNGINSTLNSVSEKENLSFQETFVHAYSTFEAQHLLSIPDNDITRGLESFSASLHEFLHVTAAHLHEAKVRKTHSMRSGTTHDTERERSHDLDPLDARAIECLLEDFIDAKICQAATSPIQAVEQSIMDEIMYFLLGVEERRIPIQLKLPTDENNHARNENIETTQYDKDQTIVHENNQTFVYVWSYANAPIAYIAATSQQWRKCLLQTCTAHISRSFGLPLDICAQYTAIGIQKFITGHTVLPTEIEFDKVQVYDSPQVRIPKPNTCIDANDQFLRVKYYNSQIQRLQKQIDSNMSGQGISTVDNRYGQGVSRSSTEYPTISSATASISSCSSTNTNTSSSSMMARDRYPPVEYPIITTTGTSSSSTNNSSGMAARTNTRQTRMEIHTQAIESSRPLDSPIRHDDNQNMNRIQLTNASSNASSNTSMIDNTNSEEQANPVQVPIIRRRRIIDGMDV